MIKSTTMRSALGIILICLMNSLKGMEDPRGSISTGSDQSGNGVYGDPESANIEGVNPKERDEKIIFGDLMPSFQPIKEEITFNNIYKSLMGFNKDVSLHILANVLYFQHWLIEELRALSFHTKESFETARPFGDCCFFIEGKQLCEHERGECNFLIKLDNQFAQLLATNIVKPLWFEQDIWEDDELLNDFLYEANLWLQCEDREVNFVAGYIKHYITTHWMTTRLYQCEKDMVFMFANMEFGDYDLVKEVCAIISKPAGLRNLLAKFLIQKGIFAVVQKFIPNFLSLVELCWQFKKGFYKVRDKHEGVFKRSEIYLIHNRIEKIINLYEKTEDSCKKINELVAGHLSNLSKEYREIFLVRGSHPASKNLTVPLYVSGFRDYLKEREHNEKNKFSFIEDLVSKEPKNQKNTGTVKRKKRSRNRRRDKNKATEESVVAVAQIEEPVVTLNRVLLEEEVIKYPLYADRLDKWFNGTSEEEEAVNAHSIIYHTYSKLADYFIQKYGVWHKQSNRLLPHINDSAYYMAGEIAYADGLKEEVVFGICFHKGKCYHRGFSDKIDSKYMEPDEYAKFLQKFEKNKLLQATSKIQGIKKLITINDENTEYEETPYAVKIYDAVHNIVITLFKQEV